MNKRLPFIFAVIAGLSLYCGGGSVRDKGKKVLYQIIPPDLRVEKYPKTFNLKAEGPVEINCGGKVCTDEEIAKLSVSQIKSFPKKGAWSLYAEKIDENKNKYSVLTASGNYSDNKKNGEWKYFYESGEILRSVTYVNDMKQGVEKKFKKDGTQTEEITYSNDKKNGPSWKKNNQGEMQEEGSYLNDQKDGLWVFYEKGKKKTEETLLNGKKYGPYKSYHEDGSTVMSEGNYTDDVRTGNWKIYYENGSLQGEGSYKPATVKGEEKSLRSGLWKEYYRNGDLFATGQRDHIRKGVWSFYDKGNVLRFKGQMSGEMTMSTGEVYDESGVLSGKGSFAMSLFTIREDDTFNSKYRPGTPFTFYKNGQKVFDVLSTNASGDTIAVEYKNGVKTGQGPIMPMVNKKNGCWTEGGKKVYYMAGRPNQKMGKMQGCR